MTRKSLADRLKSTEDEGIHHVPGSLGNREFTISLKKVSYHLSCNHNIEHLILSQNTNNWVILKGSWGSLLLCILLLMITHILFFFFQEKKRFTTDAEQKNEEQRLHQEERRKLKRAAGNLLEKPKVAHWMGKKWIYFNFVCDIVRLPRCLLEKHIFVIWTDISQVKLSR